MNRSLCSFLLVVGVAAQSTASFEMLLALDFNGKKVNRYDGQTGAFLGSFGAGFMAQPASLTLNQSRNEVYVHDRISRNIFAFNYNTGEYLRNFDTGSEFYSWISTDNSGNILVASSSAGTANQMRRYSPTGTLLNIWIMPTTGPIFSAVQSSNGIIWAPENSLSPFNIYQFSTGNSTAVASYPLGGDLGIGGDVRSNNGFVYFPSGGGTMYSYFNQNSPNIVSSINLAGMFSEAFGLGFGHGSVGYFAGNSSGTGTIWRRNFTTGFMSKLVDAPATSFSSLAVVVAPEPSMLTAMGMGIVAILRRRKK